MSRETRQAAASQSLGVLSLVHARGRHGDVGFQIGADRADQVQHMVDTYRRLFREAGDLLNVDDWAHAVRLARTYQPFIEAALPQYVEEMQGLADGAGVRFDDILVLNSLEAITSDRLVLGCTSLAVSSMATADGSVLAAHNEDWYPADIDDVYLVRAEPEGEPPFLAITYGGLLPNIGLNAAGIAQCCDTVYPNDVRLGIPRILVSRAVLAAETVDQAITAALHPQRAAGYNHLLISADGQICNLEASATDFDRVPAVRGTAAHTNHYLSERMRVIEQDLGRGAQSRARLARAQAGLASLQGGADPEGLVGILTDHDGEPHSICCHAEEVPSLLDRQRTIASIVMNVSEGTLLAAWGNPCQADFAEYRLAGMDTPHSSDGE